MKRLVMLVMVVAAATTVMSGTVFAQGKDIAGSWVLDATKSGSPNGPPTLAIALTAKSVSVGMGAGAGQTITLPLDGAETELEHGMKGKAVWNKSTLEITTTDPSHKEPQTISFSRSEEWLVMAGKSPKGPMQLFFKKAPPKL